MNKDVIYIEPEDDITDIITKIEKAKNKIVALVPPKKAGVFRSIVNIKLIAKAGVSAEKNIVIVTTDPSIVKLAAATKLPVTESLQSAPAVPSLAEEETEEPEETASEEEKAEEPEEEPEATEEEPEEKAADEPGEETEEKPAAAKKEKKVKKPSKLADNKVVAWIQEHRNLSIAAGIFGLIVLIGLIWAFGVAPAVDINVAIKTEKKNFSQNVKFTNNLSDEDAKEGKFYLDKKQIEEVKEVEFEATGKKNLGEKASGDVVVYAYFKEKGTTAVAAGSIFTINGLSFVSDEAVNITWDGKSLDVCDNRENASSLLNSGCSVSARVRVKATQSGEKYNVAASNRGWDTVAPVGVYSDKAMSGGSDKMVTVVQQSDIEQAKKDLASETESVNKEKLYETVSENELIIESSFKQETSDATSTPALDTEVKEGEKAKLKVTTIATVYVIDKVKLEEYINEVTELKDDQKIYEIGNVRIENFVEVKEETSAKLKAYYFIGPRITESELLERVLGKGIGDATHEIKDIYGVGSVDIKPSYPWVSSIPGDSNKVSISFEIKDQDGNSVKNKSSEDEE